MLEKYANLICRTQLRLEPGDMLTINCEPHTAEFAHLLATVACRYTSSTVQVVSIVDGKVNTVTPVEPDVLEIMRPKPKTNCICKLTDYDRFPFNSLADLETLKDNMIELSRFSLLSEPIVLDRRIAIPWAVIPIFGEKVARLILDDELADSNDAARVLEVLMRLDDPDPDRFWDGQFKLLKYRQGLINNMKPKTIHIKNDTTDLTFDVAENTTCVTNVTTLRSGRSFTSFLPSQELCLAAAKDSVNGTFTQSKPFLLLGQKVTGASFTYRDGKLVKFDSETGYDVLKAFFDVDEDASKLGEIAICDCDTAEYHYQDLLIHPTLALPSAICLVFGGVNPNMLQMTDENELGQINQSVVRFPIAISDEDTQLFIDDRHVVEDGVFSL